MSSTVTRRGSASSLPTCPDPQQSARPRRYSVPPRQEQGCFARVLGVIHAAAEKLCPTDRYEWVAEAEALTRRIQASNS